MEQSATARLAEVAAELAAIQAECGADSLAELRERANASERVRACDAGLEQARAELVPLGSNGSAGLPDAVRAEIAQRTAQELEAEDAELHERDSDDVGELGSLQAEIGSLTGLVEGEGSDAAAGLESQRATLHAELAEHTERYVQVKLAHYLLDREVERYRIDNQGPLLERAGELFRLGDGEF